MVINPNVFPGEGFADPHAIVENGRVYIFAGRDDDAKNGDYCRMPKWTIVSSDDLIHWRKEADILPKGTCMGEPADCWAGHITKKDDTYYWYFSNRNTNIGVMTAKNITGPYTDALGKPLIEEGFAPTKSYDPCVVEENGTYTMFFGFQQYYCCTLGDDLLSVDGAPVAIQHLDENGAPVMFGDKPNVFKHGDWYYLVSGADYGMSRQLMGPYQYVGAFVGGGHNHVFEFKGQLYVCYEFHDTNIYFRGVGIAALNFGTDGKVLLEADNPTVFHQERLWDFSKDSAKWFLTNGEDCTYENGAISYILHPFVGLRCPVFPGMFLEQDYQLQLKIESSNAPQRVKVIVETVHHPYPKHFADVPDTALHTEIITVYGGMDIYCVPIVVAEKVHLKNISLYAFGPEEEGVLRVHSVKCVPFLAEQA